MSELERWGVSRAQLQHQQHSGSVHHGELEDDDALHGGLPREARLKASFSKEGLGTKLVKLFKKELQTGDPAFDDVVYVSTDTSDATAAFLSDPSLRATIAELVDSGGVQIEGTTVSCELLGKMQNEPAELLRLVTACMG